MAAIKMLLNPAPELEERTIQFPSPTPKIEAKELCPQTNGRRKQKLPKDVAVFNRGSIRGECRYPPYDYQDEELAIHHRQFELHPMGEISGYPRHIPYNS